MKNTWLILVFIVIGFFLFQGWYHATKKPSGVAKPVISAMSIQIRDTSLGKVLTDPKGMTLYVFDRDMRGKSTCTGSCAQSWPPLKASKDAKPSGKFTLITRADGTSQWSYKGKPVYTWVGDKKPGDTSGDGIRGVWHVTRP